MPELHASTSKSLALRMALLAALLLGLGFVAGYGFQSRQHSQLPDEPINNDNSATEEETPIAPVVKGLRVRFDDRLLAFTGIYNASQQAARFAFDLKTRQMSIEETPAGWQDYIAEWSPDGSKILFEREKIPRAAAEASAGLYEEKISPAPLASTQSTQNGTPAPTLKETKPLRSEPQPLAEGVSIPGEKITAGQWNRNDLIIKTRREPKSLYLLPQSGPRAGEPLLLDQASVTYHQNRAVQENGKATLYVVRNFPDNRRNFALFRVQDGKTRQLSVAFQDIVWAYISENIRWMVVCRYAENGEDWVWSLYSVTPTSAQLVKEAEVPGDVIAVYWSPDFKQILGSSGEKLWLVEIPSLKVNQLGERADWNADDASWLHNEKAVVVAANGVLWKVRTADGKATQMWRFPQDYWN
jgi:hypothetical protein